MASVRKRTWEHKGQTKQAWVVQYCDAEGKQRIKTFKSKREADAGRLEIELGLEQGTHVAAKETWTFADAAREYLLDCERKHKTLGRPAHSTVEGIRWALDRYVIPRFGKTLLTDLDPQQVQDWLDQQAGDRAFDTVQHFRMHLLQVEAFAMRRHRLKRPKLREFKLKVNSRKAAIAIPTREQVQAIFAALEKRQWREHDAAYAQRRAFMALAVFAGLRLGEVCGLMWKHVHLDAGVIEIRHSYSRTNGLRPPKSDHVRDVAMIAPVRDALAALLPLRAEGEAFVFATKEGKRWTTQHVHSAIWRPLLRRAGLMATNAETPPFHVHALRHVNVSMLIALGVNPVQIARHVGHQKVSTTLNVYGHLFPGDEAVRASLNDIGNRFAATWGRQEQLTHCES